jgi:uncharacterized protein
VSLDFRSLYGTLGETERRTFTLARGKVTNTATGDRLKIVGHASVFGSPSVEMVSRAGAFTEYIQRGAFDAVLARKPDCLLLWDHSTLHPLARTTAGTLELTANAHGLRYYAEVTPTSYAADLRNLMADGVVTGSSFAFTVAPGGETWTVENGRVTRTISEVGELFDVTVCAAPAYPASDSALARTFLDYAAERGLLRTHPAADARRAKLLADLELRRRRVSTVT